MTARPSPRLAAILLAFAGCAAGAVVAMGAAALVGWIFSIEGLKTLLRAGRLAMNPVTAVGLVLAGCSLILLMPNPAAASLRRRTALAGAAVVALIGALKFASYILPLPIDRLLFHERVGENSIAPHAAGGFLAIGLGLLLLDYRTGKGHRPTIPLALLTTALAMLALTGSFYGITGAPGIDRFMSMPFNTAIALLLLGMAILGIRPGVEPVATILSDTAGGVVARRLVPAAAFLPLLVGWICLLGSERRLYDRPFGQTLYTLLTTAVFMVLIWWNARFLLKLDVERRRAERKADEEHHLLRALIDNLPDMVYVKDTEHRFLLNNLAHARTLGAAGPEEMLGKTDVDYFPPATAEEFRAEEKQVMESGVAMLDKEQKIVDITGQTRALSVAKVPFRDTRGRTIGIVGISHDISRRKLAEEERDRYFTMSADMMGIAGLDGYFKRVNPAFETTLGYSVEELTSRPWLDFVHPDDQAATIAEGEKLNLGFVTLFFENRYRCKDGSYRWLSWTAVPVAREQRIYAVARDITERRLVEEQLRDTNRRLEEVLESELQAQQGLRAAQSTMVQTEKLAGLGQMVAGVAHEINNPLSFVSNNVAVLQRDLRGILQLLELYAKADVLIERENPPLLAALRDVARQMDLEYVTANLQELLARSRDGLKRIQQIVKDLRDFARLDESELSECDLNEGIQSTVNIVLGHAKKRGVQIITELGTLPRVMCQPAKINQVVMNLLTNAIDASGQSGKVTLRTRVDDDDKSVLIEVSDTGTGIDPAIRARIFDPFFTTKPQGQGTGLGLSISYGIVRDHNGTIDVQSKVGKGSVFTVKLPICRPGKEKPEVRDQTLEDAKQQ